MGESKPCPTTGCTAAPRRQRIYVLHRRLDETVVWLHQDHLESLDIQIDWVRNGKIFIFLLKNLNQIYQQFGGN